jgi:L-lactate dehydrogenase (cytochrome)
MRPGEVRDLLRLTPPRRRDVLEHCRTIADVRDAARRRLPRPVFDYVDGGADEELSLAANEAGWREFSFRPRVLADVSAPDLSTTILGAPAAVPFGLAPTGYTRMIHPAGELAVGRAAAAAGAPYVLSTMASTSLEDVRAGLPGADLWFQLYVWKDRGVTRELVARAWERGYRVLEVAVDTAVSGQRVRDLRNGLTIPPQLTPATAVRIGIRPRYWTTMLRHPAMTFANFDGLRAESGFTIESISTQFDPSVGWDRLAELRELWPGRLTIKGPVGPDDALTAAAAGVDAVHLSNHGGRQLDRSIAPVHLIRPVREAVGDRLGILVDSGIRHGADIATALALGADAAFVGRPYLYGLAVAQERGVAHVIDLLRRELTRTMQLLGVTSVTELRALGPALLSSRAAAPAAGR